MRRFFIVLGVLFLCITHVHATSFTDEDSLPDWATQQINALVEKEILSGNSDGTFAPYRQMNRAEFCKILVNATGADKYLPLQSHFPDVQRDDWFFDYVETALYHGWLEGYPDGTFRPGNKVNRAEAAKIIANAFHLDIPESSSPQWYARYFEALQNYESLPYNTTLQDPRPSTNPSRAEISEQIFRIMQRTGHLNDVVLAPTTSQNPIVQTPPLQESSNEYIKSASIQSLPTESSAGTLEVFKNSSALKRITVAKNEKNVVLHSLKFSSKNGVSELAGLQFRKIGNGPVTNYTEIWLEQNGKPISAKVKPDNDLMYIAFSNTLAIGTSEKTILLKGNISPTAQTSSTRWTLFLPEWINANTSKKVGFFPFGGRDVEIP